MHRSTSAPPAYNPARAAIALAGFGFALTLRPLLFHLAAFRRFYAAHPWQLSESLWKAGWILVALATVALAVRGGLRAAVRELGLAGSEAPRGLLFAFAAALPALVTFALAFPLALRIEPWPLALTAFVSPVSEELLFRGLAFRQLYARAGWPMWLALLVTVIPFAWGHVGQAGPAASAVVLLQVLAVTGLGAALFAWLLVRSGYNLWFVIGLHALLNSYWYLFAVSGTAVGGWLSNLARLACVIFAVWLSGLLGRRRSGEAPALSAAPAP